MNRIAFNNLNGKTYQTYKEFRDALRKVYLEHFFDPDTRLDDLMEWMYARGWVSSKGSEITIDTTGKTTAPTRIAYLRNEIQRRRNEIEDLQKEIRQIRGDVSRAMKEDRVKKVQKSGAKKIAG